MALQDGFSPSFWQQDNTTIATTGTHSTPIFPSTLVKSVRYIVSVWNDTNSKVKSFEVMLHNNSGTLSHTVFGITGAMDISVATSLNAGNINLDITNNEAFSIDASITYLQQGF